MLAHACDLSFSALIDLLRSTVYSSAATLKHGFEQDLVLFHKSLLITLLLADKLMLNLLLLECSDLIILNAGYYMFIISFLCSVG